MHVVFITSCTRKIKLLKGNRWGKVKWMGKQEYEEGKKSFGRWNSKGKKNCVLIRQRCQSVGEITKRKKRNELTRRGKVYTHWCALAHLVLKDGKKKWQKEVKSIMSGRRARADRALPSAGSEPGVPVSWGQSLWCALPLSTDDQLR